MPHVQFGGEFVCGHAQKRCQAIIDSGTGFIAAPQSVWPKVYNVCLHCLQCLKRICLAASNF